ncbi:MAG: hypothetical protein ABJR46_02085 [Tateyamaria sp.]|uniref:hypothetical protein n=2 Tax=Tateyamaria sp. TaxID=1929288 RepID=UPI00329C35C9
MIVAPPSGNTFPPEPYQVLHVGFDTIALSIKTMLPPDLLDYFESQKQIAEKEQRDQLVEWNGVKLHLKGHGGKGYRFIASGGPLGANWAFKKPNAKDPWGVRVTFGSTFLATLGLGAARAHLDAVLDKLGMRFAHDDISISRVDICTDILAPDFALDADAFVMHSSTNRRDYVTGFDASVNGKSGRVTSVTIGSTRARQVIIYDKRLEVIQKQKAHWWAIWNKTRSAIGQPDLSPVDPSQKIWRVEFRAGKDLLKDTWNIRTWADMFARFGDLCAQTGDVIRYTVPNTYDRNRARWPNHPLWEVAVAEIVSDLSEMREGEDPTGVKSVIREQHIATLIKNIRGTSVTLAALEGRNFEALPDFFGQVATKLTNSVNSEPEHVAKMLKNAQDRYTFVT